MKLNNGIFAILLMIAVLALVPAVSAYSTPATQEEVLVGWVGDPSVLPNGVFNGYAYTDTIIPKKTYENALASCNSRGLGLDFISTPIWSTIDGLTTTHWTGDTINGGMTNAIYFDYWGRCTDHKKYDVNWWIGYNTASPVFHYHNFTVTVRSTSSGITIPRANVALTYNNSAFGDFATQEVKTDIIGDAHFDMVGTLNTSTVYITAAKVGYNTSSISYTPGSSDEVKAFDIYLDDAPWDTSSTKAIVYLDIIDEDTSAAISGATIGIKNTTNEVNPWYYNTYEDSTIAFSTDGTNDLSVGQTVEFAGYKSGSYSAGHTEPISILAPVSHASLSLSKSDIVDPLDIVNGSYYWYPATVVDSVTGNAISGSDLNYQVTDDLYWQNKTSATGKFNMTGKGPTGVIPFESGDTIMIEGYASGYARGGFALGVDSDNTGTTQYVNLVPSDYTPGAGNFTAVFLAYDDDTTAALSGVSLALKKASFSTSKTTGTSGSATFKNLIGGDSYTLTAAKSGYTTLTKTITGGSGNVVSIDVPMSSVSVNPGGSSSDPSSVSTSTTMDKNASAMNEKGAAGLSSLIDTLMAISGVIIVGLLLIFGSKVVRAIRDALGI
jgi:hypothetical protein